MATEYCRGCAADTYRDNQTPEARARHRAASEESINARRARHSHSGTGCRFGQCQTHCKCPKHVQRQWRERVRNDSRHMRCITCGVHTKHVCIQPAGRGIGAHRTRCAMCCVTCPHPSFMIEATPMNARLEADYVSDLCSLRASQMWGYEYRPCSSCLVSHPLIAFWWAESLHDTCVFCPAAGQARCRTCSSYMGTGTDIAAPCAECGSCSFDHAHSEGDASCRCRQCCRSYSLLRCCRCTTHSRPRLRHVVSISFQHTERPVITKRNPFTRAAGVEMEIAGFNNPEKGALENVWRACEKWDAAIGTDGSIGTEEGVEIRTSPAGGKALVYQLRDICNALKVAGAFANSNCGLHVHVDVRDIVEMYSIAMAKFNATPQNISYDAINAAEREVHHKQNEVYNRIISAVSGAQGQLVEMVDPQRRGSQYCKTLPPGLDWRRSQSLERYYLLNTRSITRHKTLEFRLHEGTVNKRIITAWTLLCIAMIDTAVKATEEPAEIRKRIETNPAHWLESIAPTRDAKRYVGWRQRKMKKQEAA